MSTLTIRMPEDKHARLRGLAREKGISVNRLIDEIATLALAEFDCETRTRARVTLGSKEEGLALLDKLDPAHGAKVQEPADELIAAERMQPDCDEVANVATRGGDVSRFFSNAFEVVRPMKRVDVDLTAEMLRELDERAAKLNVSRHAVITTLLAEGLRGSRGQRGKSPES